LPSRYALASERAASSIPFSAKASVIGWAPVEV
jgi:hypothetical protein